MKKQTDSTTVATKRRDAISPVRGMACHAGFSLIEVMGAVGMLGVMLAVALPHFDRSRMAVNEAVQSITGDLKMARFRAITSGSHYLVRLGTNAGGKVGYEVLRMREAAPGVWTALDTDRERQKELSDDVWFALDEGTGVEIEFNTRGMLASDGEIEVVTLTLEDRHGAERRITVFPSGQVRVGDDPQGEIDAAA